MSSPTVSRTTSDPAAAPVSKSAYPPPASEPTQHGPKGILFDFNLGCRVVLPPGDWSIALRDLDTGNIIFQSRNRGALVTSTKRYFIRFRIEIWDHEKELFTHDYDATGQ